MSTTKITYTDGTFKEYHGIMAWILALPALGVIGAIFLAMGALLVTPILLIILALIWLL